MFLDTSGLLSLIDGRDGFHTTAMDILRGTRHVITHNYILAELIPLANARGCPRQRVHKIIATLLESPKIEIHWIDAEMHFTAMDFLSRRLDKAYSLCDAVSFLQMTMKGDYEALTTDRHFEQEGFVRLLK